ncbi:MAG: ABC transporter permease, partial [Bacteroidota bacterium]
PMDGGSRGQVLKESKPISFEQAERFRREFNIPAQVSVSALAMGTSTIRHGSAKTNPNVSLLGADENYLTLSAYELAEGRTFSPNEMSTGANVIILGADVVEKLFPNISSVADREVFVGAHQFRIIGVLKSKGNTFGFAGDNQCLIPVTNVRKQFATSLTDYTINIHVDDPGRLTEAGTEAMGLMRAIRHDKLNAD